MNLNRFTLQFTDDKKEQSFKRYYYKNYYKDSRVSFLLTTILYSLFGYLDYISIPDHLNLFLGIRFLIVVPLLLSVFALSFFKIFKKIWQALIFSVYIIAALGIIIMIVVIPEDFIYSNGLLLIFFAGFVFIKLRFVLSSIAGLISIVIYNLLAFYYTQTSPEAILINNLFFISATLIGIFAAYHAEESDRRNFLLIDTIAEKNKEISDINLGLEKKVEQRTDLLNRRNEELLAEIARRITIEQELIIAKEKAEESDKLKSAFLANMSHEIRTPMNGIIGFANLLREADDEEELNEFIEIIIKNGDHLLSLINDIIDLSKIEAGILKITTQSFDLNALTEEVYKMFLMDPNVIERKLKLSYKNGIEVDQCIINTDRLRLKQILINIINNACKYTDEGSIEFSYKIQGSQLHFSVKDTGIGIPEEQQEFLFERFMQVTLNNTPTREGTGLGLAITKTYLKMMGGNIKVRSRLNEGSEFSFYLPITIDNQNENNV
jgi:signal transduction histidine kinase